MGSNISLHDSTVTSLGLQRIHPGFTSRSNKREFAKGGSFPLRTRSGRDEIGQKNKPALLDIVVRQRIARTKLGSIYRCMPIYKRFLEPIRRTLFPPEFGLISLNHCTQKIRICTSFDNNNEHQENDCSNGLVWLPKARTTCKDVKVLKSDLVYFDNKVFDIAVSRTIKKYW